MKWDFSAPSRWELIWGCKGNTPVTEASVSFKPSDLVVVEWHVRAKSASWGGHQAAGIAWTRILACPY
jgi:hypothetical protein